MTLSHLLFLQIIIKPQIIQNITFPHYLMLNSQISADAFEMFIQSIKNGNIIELLQLNAFYKEIILPIFKSKPSLVSLYRIQLQNLLNAIDNKLLILPKTQVEIFPGISNIVSQIKDTISPFKRIKQVQDRIQIKDNYFLQFLRDQQVRLVNHDNSSYYDLLENEKSNQKLKVTMPILISSKTFTKQWQTPFTILRQKYKSRKDPQLTSKRNQVYSGLKDQKISAPMCLGCTQYYYEKLNIRFLDLHPMDVIVISRIKELNTHKDLLKNSICALLNSGGGILLFDCLEEYMQILPVGSFVSEKQKQLYMQQISQIFKYFYPKISFGLNLDLQFVPIAKNPFQNYQNAANIAFTKGKYVTRLRVWNNQQWRLISYDPSSNENVFYTRKGGSTVRLSGKHLVRQMKSTFKKYYCPEIYNKQVFERSQNVFQNHQCVEPKMGIQLENKQNDYREQLTEYDLQNSFHYVSFIFLKGQDQQKFQIALKGGHNNPLQIVPYCPATIDNLCLLFHDTAHREMKVQFDKAAKSLKRSTKNKNQTPLILFVENGLQLENRLEEKQFKQLVNFIKNKNSTQTLKYFEGQNKYFLTSQFKATLFFLFIKLREMNFHSIKVVKLDISRLENDEQYRLIQAPHHF